MIARTRMQGNEGSDYRAAVVVHFCMGLCCSSEASHSQPGITWIHKDILQMNEITISSDSG